MFDDRAQRQLEASKLMLQHPQIEKRDYVRITRAVTIEGPWNEVAMQIVCSLDHGDQMRNGLRFTIPRWTVFSRRNTMWLHKIEGWLGNIFSWRA